MTPIAPFDDFQSNCAVFRDDGGVFEVQMHIKKQKEEAMQQTLLEDKATFRVIGQVFGTYLLLECGDRLILVDQHAAVERLRYDRLLAEYEKGEIAVQPLLIPARINLSPAEYKIVSEKVESLKAIGVELVPFGEDCYKLASIPSILVEMDLNRLIAEIVSDKPDKHFPLIHERLAYAACRSSIKGNTYLSNEEIEGLVQMYFKDGLPLQCPHGRPAYFTYTKKDLEKLFKRIV